jgi:hypothetical protein
VPVATIVEASGVPLVVRGEKSVAMMRDLVAMEKILLRMRGVRTRPVLVTFRPNPALTRTL